MTAVMDEDKKRLATVEIDVDKIKKEFERQIKQIKEKRKK